MATKSKSRSKSKSRNKSKSRSKSKTKAGSSSHGGVHVTKEMLSPKVARVTVELDLEELVARAIKKLGRGIKKRRSKRGTKARRSRRATASS